ncbi:MAG: methionyl-tRNA formyltransferase [Bacteroidales bacterium]
MEAKKLRIVFMGTPEFSVAILKAIVEKGYTVAGVVTAPDKPSGRGLQVHEPEVKKFAQSQHLKVMQPEKLKSPEFIEELKSLNADLQIVVAFRMLPEQVWKMPKIGTFNLHASLLPQYRGAAPINWAIINGENKTGLTTFLIDNEIDTGKILLKHEMEIFENETAGHLHDRMMIEGQELVIQTIELLASGTFKAVKQQELNQNEELKPAPKIFKENCRIGWNKNVIKIYNFIRGLSPYPCAWSVIENKESGKQLTIKIFETSYRAEKHGMEPGSIKLEEKTLLIAANEGFISPTEVQLEGKKKMPIDQFLRGFPIHSYKFI